MKSCLTTFIRDGGCADKVYKLVYTAKGPRQFRDTVVGGTKKRSMDKMKYEMEKRPTSLEKGYVTSPTEQPHTPNMQSQRLYYGKPISRAAIKSVAKNMVKQCQRVQAFKQKRRPPRRNLLDVGLKKPSSLICLADRHARSKQRFIGGIFRKINKVAQGAIKSVGRVIDHVVPGVGSTIASVLGSAFSFVAGGVFAKIFDFIRSVVDKITGSLRLGSKIEGFINGVVDTIAPFLADEAAKSSGKQARKVLQQKHPGYLAHIDDEYAKGNSVSEEELAAYLG